MFVYVQVGLTTSERSSSWATDDMETHYKRCYLLRRSNYRETSLLLVMLTEDSQCVHAVFKGARRKKGVDIDLLVPYEMSWRGDYGLVTIRTCEVGEANPVSGSNLYSALYLNELIRRGLKQDQRATGLFEAYEVAISELASSLENIEPTLRRFERNLLKVLGYELSFLQDGNSGQAIQQDGQYCFRPDYGFSQDPNQSDVSWSGEHLLAIANDEFDKVEVRRTAKVVLSQALRFHLGNSAIKAQELLLADKYRQDVRTESQIG